MAWKPGSVCDTVPWGAYGWLCVRWTPVLVLIQLLAHPAACHDPSVFVMRSDRFRTAESSCGINGTNDLVTATARWNAHELSRIRGGEPAVRQEQGTYLPTFLQWLFSPNKRQRLMRNPGSAVMVQSFDWELLSDRGHVYWELQKQIPALASAGINVVWFPPPSDSADLQGYLPNRWYNIMHESLLQTAIEMAKEAGMLTMVDVVLNHRTGAALSERTNEWTRFSNPDWEEWAIVKDDWKCHPHETEKFCLDNCTCGGADTGENACFAPDIDHTNRRVQRDVAAWLRWLRTHVGFDAFRFDNTKGYAAKYTAQYIRASKPVLSVGEYFDSNRERVSAWIKGSRGTARTFDFGTRYKLRDSVREDTYGHLMDTLWGPMMWWDKEHAVTFLDNHDTAGLLNDRFGDEREVAMGYAYILTHPGLPCVFWQDWLGPNQESIKALVRAREAAGVTAASPWTVASAGPGLYAAFVGSRLAMKLGSRPWSPNQGLSRREWAVECVGSGWAVWLRREDGGKEGDAEGDDLH